MSGVLSRVRAEYLLPFACAAGAVCVGASELMSTFEFDLGPGGGAVRTIEAADRHSYALLVLAVFALAALAVAVIAGSRPAAVAVAVTGGLALLFFLVVDLPDVGQQGTLDEPSAVFFSTEAKPGDGFWLELVGSVALAASGGALATLRPEQLRALWRRPKGEREARDTEPEPRERVGGHRERRRTRGAERSDSHQR